MSPAALSATERAFSDARRSAARTSSRDCTNPTASGTSVVTRNNARIWKASDVEARRSRDREKIEDRSIVATRFARRWTSDVVAVSYPIRRFCWLGDFQHLPRSASLASDDAVRQRLVYDHPQRRTDVHALATH